MSKCILVIDLFEAGLKGVLLFQVEHCQSAFELAAFETDFLCVFSFFLVD